MQTGKTDGKAEERDAAWAAWDAAAARLAKEREAEDAEDALVEAIEANARLTAAAPALLAACQRFAKAMQEGRYPELQGVACDAFEAIAKAID